MKNISAVILFLMAFCIPGQGQQARHDMPLEKYGFERNKYIPSEIPLLLGNSEMYGLTDKKGGGFDHLWFTDVWENAGRRKAISGPLFECVSDKNSKIKTYKQEIMLTDGVANTHVEYEDGRGYSSTVFCSMNNKHLLGIKIKNTSPGKETRWTLKLLRDKVFLKFPSKSEVQGRSYWFGYWQAFAFKALTDKEIRKNDIGLYEFSLQPGDSITLIYSFFTIFDSLDFEKPAYQNTIAPKDFDQLLTEHKKAFKKTWDNTASIILPEGDYARLFYRSIYCLFAVAGDDKFLPAEGISVSSDPYLYWDMAPFTYGGGGFAALSYTALGNQELAKKMLTAHFKPKALELNGRTMFPKGKQPLYHGKDYLGEVEYLKEYSDDIWLFGHGLNADNTNNYWFWDNSHIDWQVHLNGFAGSMFHNYSQYFQDDAFTVNKTYPVLRGTAEFWRNIAKWNDTLKAYVFPPLNSLTENLFQKSPLDAVLAAKWNLMMAARYARSLSKDIELAKKWDDVADKLYIPQNEKKYLEYLGDDGNREGGGYQGIRGPVYLTWPTYELIPYLNKQKIQNTYDELWKRNKNGEGMISFLANWFALADAYMGNGDKAYTESAVCLTMLDSSKTSLYEVLYEPRPYFLDGYASFALVPAAMMLQSYDNIIYPFPAVPKIWKDVSFYDLPACSNISVSGEMKGGKVKWISYVRNGKEIFRQKGNKPVRIAVNGEDVILTEIKK